jgi:hypothetical protein
MEELDAITKAMEEHYEIINKHYDLITQLQEQLRIAEDKEFRKIVMKIKDRIQLVTTDVRYNYDDAIETLDTMLENDNNLESTFDEFDDDYYDNFCTNDNFDKLPWNKINIEEFISRFVQGFQSNLLKGWYNNK